MTSYVKKAVCGRCGKVNIMPEYPDKDFKCDNCGFDTLFCNQELIIKRKINLEGLDNLQFLCGKCESPITFIKKENNYIDAYKCKKCNKEYSAICFKEF